MEQLLTACREASSRYARMESGAPVAELLRQDGELTGLAARITAQLQQAAEIYAPPRAQAPASGDAPLKAVTWNIERGKKFSALARSLREDPRLNDADFYLLTEVDWGMARSENRNIAAELGEALGLYTYFAPSYFNFTLGHGSEREREGENRIGLHGKAILSRYRLQNLRAIPLPNAIDKLHSKEARLGQKRALVADLPWGERRLTLACTHLDAFSSPAARALQLGAALDALREVPQVLLAGDWNTNTLDTTRGPSVLWSVVKQILGPGPQEMISRHFPQPDQKFDRPLFQTLEAAGFDFQGCNELGAGTYDLVSNDRELGHMARDQFPDWIVRWINRQIQKGGGKISLKLDWFAARGIEALERRVIPLQAGKDYPSGDRPSDHHPALLRFRI